MLRNFLLSLLTITMIIANISYGLANNDRKITKKNIIPIQTGLVIDVDSGKVLYAKNPKAKIHPASLTKWMTLYLTFEAIKKGHLKLDKKLYISEHASAMPPCKMGLAAGDFITVRAAISSLIVGSHNDIAAVLAENISGSHEKFARLMTKTAKQLGMKDTNFKNSSGLHHQQQITTPLDLVKLALAIKRDHQKFYPLLAQTSFSYRDKIYNGHNHVMKNYKYARASKTGFTNPSGYNLITHASTANKNIIAVITGHKSAQQRNQQMVLLLDKHLGVKTISLANKKQSTKTKLASNVNIKKRANKRSIKKI